MTEVCVRRYITHTHTHRLVHLSRGYMKLSDFFFSFRTLWTDSLTWVFTNVLFWSQPVSAVWVFMCHRLRSTNRPLYGPLKDNEEHRNVALFREKGRGGTSAVLALTLVTEQQLFIHNSFVLSAVDHIHFFFSLSLPVFRRWPVVQRCAYLFYS